MYFMAHSFYAYLVKPIVVGVLLTCQSLEPKYKMSAFFTDVFPRKNISYIRVNTVHFIFRKPKVFALQETLNSYLQFFSV